MKKKITTIAHVVKTFTVNKFGLNTRYKITAVVVLVVSGLILTISFVSHINNRKSPEPVVTKESKEISKNTSEPIEEKPLYIPRYFTEALLGDSFIPKDWKTFSIASVPLSLKFPSHWDVHTWGNYAFINNKNIQGGYLFIATARLHKNTPCMDLEDDCIQFSVSYQKGRDEDIEATHDLTVLNQNGIQGYVYSFDPDLDDEHFSFLTNGNKDRMIVTVGMNKISDELVKEIQTAISSISTQPAGNNYQYNYNWGSDTDTTNAFSISYPLSFGYWKGDYHVGVSKSGPTQLSDTEPYDYINLSIDLKDLQNQSAEEFATKEREDYINSEDWKDVQMIPGAKVTEIREVRYGVNLKGYFYSVSGYGDYDQLYLQPTNAKKIFVISKGVRDPSGQGFEDAANRIISSLKLN